LPLATCGTACAGRGVTLAIALGMFRSFLLSVPLVACGKVATSMQPAPDTPPADVAPDAPQRWAAPTYVPELTLTLPREPQLTPGRLESFYAGVGPGGGSDIVHATRADVSKPWSTPTAIAEVSSSGNDFDPFVSADGLTMWFSSDRNASASYDIFVS